MYTQYYHPSQVQLVATCEFDPKTKKVVLRNWHKQPTLRCSMVPLKENNYESIYSLTSAQRVQKFL